MRLVWKFWSLDWQQLAHAKKERRWPMRWETTSPFFVQDVPFSKEIRFLTEEAPINECSAAQGWDGFLKTNAFLILKNGLRAGHQLQGREHQSAASQQWEGTLCSSWKDFESKWKSRHNAFPLFCFLIFFWLHLMLANLQFWSFFSLRSGWFAFLNLYFVIHSKSRQLNLRTCQMMPFYTFISMAELHSFYLSSTQILHKPSRNSRRCSRSNDFAESDTRLNLNLFQDRYRLQQIVLSF